MAPCDLGGDFNIRLQDCLGGSVYSPRTSQVNDVGSTGYSLSIMGATQDVEITGHKAFNSRHAFTTNSSSTVGREGVVRDIIYRDFSIYNSAKSGGGVGGDAIDTHAASCGIVVRDGRIYWPLCRGSISEGSSATVDNVSNQRHSLERNQIHQLHVARWSVHCIQDHMRRYCWKPDRNSQQPSSATGKILSVDINGLYGSATPGRSSARQILPSVDPACILR